MGEWVGGWGCLLTLVCVQPCAVCAAVVDIYGAVPLIGVVFVEALAFAADSLGWCWVVEFCDDCCKFFF